MKEGESQNIFNKRARNLIWTALKIGAVSPEEAKAEMRTARGIAQEKGRDRITRGELRGLARKVELAFDQKRAG